MVYPVDPTQSGKITFLDVLLRRELLSCPAADCTFPDKTKFRRKQSRVFFLKFIFKRENGTGIRGKGWVRVA